jgi:hypothetical protein
MAEGGANWDALAVGPAASGDRANSSGFLTSRKCGLYRNGFSMAV